MVLFVYRLMFSGNGYTATLAALWEQCRACGIPLPQAEPVAASSMSAARAKVDEAIFKNLHAEILKRAESSQWKGHRVFAVDGSKINLPRPLLRAGYPLPQERAHYPQGLLSCLYELAPKLPIDFDLHAHGDERAAALAHLPAMAARNVVVYDRGYYSYRMLLAHAERGVHPLFRLQRNAGTTFDDFIAGSRQDELITITPGPDTLRRLGRKDPEAVPRPIPLRLVKYVHGGTEFHLATTLLDRSRYRVRELADLYHDRWGIEELYKTSKCGFELENFHSRSERGVKQEIFAHFNLIAMTRLFTNFGDAMHNSQSAPGSPAGEPGKLQGRLVRRRPKPRRPHPAAGGHDAQRSASGPRLCRNRKAAPTSKSILATTLPKTPRQMAEGTRLRSCSLSARATVPPNSGLAELRFLKRMPKFP